ncbi:MAG: acyltransferase [Hyphomicrobiaceae bacterium]|nr:acyltransferase [Hyphomicrobiaceae bacterium]
MNSTYRAFGTLRLTLAMLVVLQHALAPLAPADVANWVRPLEVGSVAVWLFFTLSGAIVVEAADRHYQGRAGDFVLNRLLRIYPCYVLALAAVVVTATLLPGAWSVSVVPPNLAGLVANVFAILPGGGRLLSMAGTAPMLELAWALRIEMTFYVILAVALLVARWLAIPLSRLLAVKGALALALYAVGGEALRGGTFEHTPYFVLGVAGYYIVRERQLRTAPNFWSEALQSPMGILAIVAVLLCVRHIVGQAPVHETGYARAIGAQLVMALTGFAVIAGLALNPFRRDSAAAHRDGLAGELSYPAYLMHLPMVAVASATVGPGLGGIIAAVIGTLALAAAVALTFERSIARYRAQIRHRHPPSAQSTQSAAGP